MARDHSAWLGTTGLLIEIDLGSRAWIRIGDRLVRGSDSHSQLEQIPDHRDMDPQYATVDQLAEITDTMASLRDAILGWQDYIVPPPPPPFSQLPRLEHLCCMQDRHLAALPVEFRMPDIERYTGIGCPRIHLQLYSTVMRGHRLMRHNDYVIPSVIEWCCSALVCLIGPFETPLEGPDETVTSFISRWREKIAQIIDRPSERDQISMIMRSLQPRFARHLMGFPQTDFGSLVQALYGIEEGISRGLWADSSLQTQRGRSGIRPRPSDVGTIGMTGHSRATYLHPPPQPVYATQAPQRPPMQFHHQYRAPPPPRPTDPLPTHDTRAVPPPPEGVHLIEFAGDEIFMMADPQAIQFDPGQIYGPPPVSPVYLQHVPPMTPFILFPEEYRPLRDVQIVTRSGRVAQPPPVDRPFAGIAAREEVQRKMMRYYASYALLSSHHIHLEPFGLI
ncbi:hypothetical protein CK203_002377 [Vitis vinifera]|uniref:Uncharacterized protein n=1 Tax=Vitis vinifera TaxID=29760 RepID=A0A438KHZ4_VITVI|nr:hypothetical protein CK203_002377 [Vitis vinifera]